ncbi:hypothetical protein KSB_03220 [Ktedonobacter robiniae]|uniref:50S ribosomal protein L34e n=1 Tax=Ktedonobacter robiniae TaxID=2778365 RepID=A0ABQ3UGL6_9CHLR|nr:hypothetical protein KSB_03220 [Ktedonobacter robiniae]
MAVPKFRLTISKWGKTMRKKARNPTRVVTRAGLTPHTKPTITDARHKGTHITRMLGIRRAKITAIPVRKSPMRYPKTGRRHLGRYMVAS